MKIYAIIKRRLFSDHIVALTTNPKDAKILKEIYSGYEKAEIVEYEEAKVYDPNRFWIYDPAGCFVDIYEDCTDEGVKEMNGSALCVVVKERDKKVAKKKAQDMLEKYKAKKIN